MDIEAGVMAVVSLRLLPHSPLELFSRESGASDSPTDVRLRYQLLIDHL